MLQLPSYFLSKIAVHQAGDLPLLFVLPPFIHFNPFNGLVKQIQAKKQSHSPVYSCCLNAIIWEIDLFTIYLLSSHMHSPSQYRHPSPIFVTVDELVLTHHYHPESLVYITVHSQCSTLYGLGQIYNSMYPPYCIMQSRFTALKILYVLPFHLNLSSVN